MTPFWIGIALGALLTPMLLVVLLGVICWFLRGVRWLDQRESMEARK
jgi:hypothetical protein